jgi:putative flippase GtrA
VYYDGNRASHFDTVRDSARVFREILKFSASSLIGFLTDYMMFAILLAVGANLIIANIGARLVSSVTNYTINRKLVFCSDAGLAKSALQYFTLAALILAGNTVTLSVLTGTLGIGSMAAKVLTELLFFAISWTVQRYLIFYDQADAEDNVSDEIAVNREPQYESVALSNDGNVRFVVQKRPSEVRRLTTVRPAALRAVRTSRRPTYMPAQEISFAGEVASSEQEI